MPIGDIQSELGAARKRLEEHCKVLNFGDRQWLREYRLAEAEIFRLEGETASANGEEYAVPLDFPVQWDVGAPLPHLIRNDYSAFLIFCVGEQDADWDGTYVTIKDPGKGSTESLALVEFIECVSAKLGSPNDEVLGGHPLHGKGLDGYTAQKVMNSRWLHELESINKIHHCYDPEFWRRKSHYVFWFHDTTFECVADSFRVELASDSLTGLLATVCQRLWSQ